MSETYSYKDGNYSSISIEELYDKQLAHDDLQIVDRFIEYDTKNKKENEVAYMTYILKKREDNGNWEKWIKVIKLCKVYNVPKELREKKALMVSQDELLHAIWTKQMNFITVYCNMPDAKEHESKGFYYCYGIQETEPVMESTEYYDSRNTEEEKIVLILKHLKELADASFGGLVRLLRGNFRQSQFLPLTMREAESIRKTIENAPNLQVIRGIPKTHISSASGVTTSMTGITTTPDGIEQNEEFIRALLHDTYANIVMAYPIPYQELSQWSSNIARELSKYKSQYSGSISHNAGISIPMVFAGNLSATMGNTSGVTDTSGETSGLTTGNSDTYSHSVGDSQSRTHNMGLSTGQSQGIADSISQANTNALTHGVSNSQTFGDSIGVSQSESNGVTDGVTNTTGVSKGHTVGTSDTYSEGKTITDTTTRSVGQSYTTGTTQGNTWGATNGTTNGTTLGTTQGTTLGTTLGTTQGTTTGNSYTIGQTTGQTIGTTDGTTVGQTLGHTTGTTIGQTTGTTDGTTTGHTVGTTTGTTDGYTTGHTTGNTRGVTDGTTVGHTTGNTITDTTGRTSTQGYTEGLTRGNTAGNTITDTTTNGRTRNWSISNTESDSVNLSTSDTHTDNHNLNFNAGFNYVANVGGGAGFGSSDADGSTQGTGHTASTGIVNGGGTTYSQAHAVGNSNSSSASVSQSNSYSLGTTNSHSVGNSNSYSNSNSHSISNSVSDSYSTSNSHSVSNSKSDSYSDSTSHSVSNSQSKSQSDSYSNSISNSNSHSVSNSQSTSDSVSRGLTNSNSLSNSTSNSMSKSLSNSTANSLSNSLSNSKSFSQSFSTAHGLSESISQGHSVGRSLSHSMGNSVSDSITETASKGVSHANSHATSEGVTRSQSMGKSTGVTNSMSQGQSTGLGKTANTGLSQSLSDAQGVSKGTTTGDSRGTGTTTGKSQALSNAQGISNAQSNALGVGQGLNFSFGPTVGVSRTYQIFDEEKGNLIKLLDIQNNRMHLATQMGAFYVDAYVVSYTPQAKKAIGLAAVNSFGGNTEIGTIQVVDPDEFTTNHLLKHASVYEPCTMKETIPNVADGYLWSTLMLTNELAALTHLPRVETGGASTVATNIPAFSVFANKNGEIFFGNQINYEDGVPKYDYFFDKKEFMHTLVCGASGCGKTTSAVRMAREVIRNYPDFKLFVLDWKKSWRVLKKFAPNGIDDFDFYGLDYNSIRPIKMNVYVPPKYLGISQWTSQMHEALCLGYGFGNKMLSVLDKAARILFLLYGVLEMDENGIPRETPNAREEIWHVNLSKVYKIVNLMKEGKGWDKGKASLREETNKYIALGKKDKAGKEAQEMIDGWLAEAGRGMQDAFDSILSKLEPYYSGELKGLYCCDNIEGVDAGKCVRIDELIDGKRIIVLEGGDLDSPSKKFVCQTIASGAFRYCSAKKNIEQRVEKRFFIMEEAHRIIENPQQGNASPLGVTEDIFNIIFNEGREFGLYAMAIVQAPSELPPAIVTNCSILIIHRLGYQDDIDLMSVDLCRNTRLDSRDIPIFLAKLPIGQAIVRINNTANHQESEPVLIQVARCETEPPDNEELIIDMDLDIPNYIKNQYMEDPCFDREGIEAMIDNLEYDYDDDNNWQQHEIS